MLIEEKSLIEWWNLPGAGKFAKAVRKKIDPLWGKESPEMKAFKVIVQYLPKSAWEDYCVTVEAADEAEARELAYDKATAEVEAYEDMLIKSMQQIA